MFAGVFDDCVPVGAAHGGDDTFFFGDALHGIFDNYAVKPFVVGESVGTAAKHKSREGVRFGEIVSISNIIFALDFNDKACRTAETHSSKC